MVIKLADDVQVAVPTWMLDPLACQQLTDEVRPRLSVAALKDLRALLDSQPLLVTMTMTNPGEMFDAAYSRCTFSGAEEARASQT